MTSFDNLDKLMAKFTSYPIYEPSQLYAQPQPQFLEPRPVNNNNTNKVSKICTINSNTTPYIPLNYDKLESEKLKFFNILKSLFAIFDPDCRGSIDINELDKFSGKNNEILKDVILHIRRSLQYKHSHIGLSKNQANSTMLSFDEFVRAADIVLSQRKQNKHQNLLTNIENLQIGRASCRERV